MQEINSANLVWVLENNHFGDNAQLKLIANELGFPFLTKKIVHIEGERKISLQSDASLAAVDVEQSDALEPPWPNMVIASGRKNAPVARWIKQRSEGKTKLVHVGRPWMEPSRFDLIITTPQYNLPDGPNIIQNIAPLTRVNLDTLGKENEYSDKLSSLVEIANNTGFICILVGGDIGPYGFTKRTVRNLIHSVITIARINNWAIVVSTSSRTSAFVADIIEDELFNSDVSSLLWRWDKEGNNFNPYLEFLYKARQIIVTGDSISMITDACAAQKPVIIFNDHYFVDWRKPWHLNLKAMTKRTLKYYRKMIFLKQRREHFKSYSKFHEAIVSSGRASFLRKQTKIFPMPFTHTKQTVERIKALVD